jgi:hypothetical protein
MVRSFLGNSNNEMQNGVVRKSFGGGEAMLRITPNG